MSRADRREFLHGLPSSWPSKRPWKKPSWPSSSPLFVTVHGSEEVDNVHELPGFSLITTGNRSPRWHPSAACPQIGHSVLSARYPLTVPD